MRDKDFGPIRLRAFGTYSYRITDPRVFYQKISGSRDQFTAEELSGQLHAMIVMQMGSYFGGSEVAFVDMAANQARFSDSLKECLTEPFKQYGLALQTFFAQNISLPEELQEKFDKLASMNLLGDLRRYTKFQTAEAIPAAAANPGGLAGAGAGIGAGMAIGQTMASAMGAGGPAGAADSAGDAANVSSQSRRPPSSRSARKARQAFSQIPCSSHWIRRRRQVLYEGNRSGKSCPRAPVRSIHNSPSKQARLGLGLRPPLGERFGWGKRGSTFAHCRSVTNALGWAMKNHPFHSPLNPKLVPGSHLT
jgi:hypothetical protein